MPDLMSVGSSWPVTVLASTCYDMLKLNLCLPFGKEVETPLRRSHVERLVYGDMTGSFAHSDHGEDKLSANER